MIKVNTKDEGAQNLGPAYIIDVLQLHVTMTGDSEKLNTKDLVIKFKIRVHSNSLDSLI